MAGEKTSEEHAKAIVDLVMKSGTAELKKSVRKWLPTRDETIGALEEIIEILHKTSKDVAISNVVGSSVSAAGGAVAIGLLIAAPFTFGATLIPSAIVGGVTAGVGGATSIGSSIAGLVIDSKQDDQVKRCIEEDRRHLEILQTKLECYRNMYRLAINLIEQTVLPESGSSSMELDLDTAGPRLGCNAARVAVTGIASSSAVIATKTAGRVAGTGALIGVRTTALAVAHTLAAVGVGLDIAMVAFNAVKLGQGAKSDIGIKLEEAVKALKDERDQFKKEYLDDSSDKYLDDSSEKYLDDLSEKYLDDSSEKYLDDSSEKYLDD